MGISCSIFMQFLIYVMVDVSPQRHTEVGRWLASVKTNAKDYQTIFQYFCILHVSCLSQKGYGLNLMVLCMCFMALLCAVHNYDVACAEDSMYERSSSEHFATYYSFVKMILLHCHHLRGLTNPSHSPPCCTRRQPKGGMNGS